MKKTAIGCFGLLAMCGCGTQGSRDAAVVPTASPAASQAAPVIAVAPGHEPATAQTPTATAHRLQNAFPSERALGDAVLLALKEKDAAMLDTFRVTEREYLDLVFPEFPEAQGEHRIPPSFHWGHLDVRSRKGVMDAIDNFGGADFELLELVTTQGIAEFRTFKVLKKVEMKVRNKADGVVSQIKVFGSVVLMDGEYKILGFPT